MPKKPNLESLRLPIVFTLLSVVFYICLVVFTAPEKQGPVQGYGKARAAGETAPLPFYWLERAPVARSRFSVDGATRAYYFLRASGLPDPQHPPKAWYVVEEGVRVADFGGRGGGGGGGRQRGGPQTPINPDADGDLPERSSSGGGRPDSPPRSQPGNTPGADVAVQRGTRQVGGTEAGPGAELEGRNRTAPKPPRAFMADVARNAEGVWLASAIIGLSGRVTLYVENDHDGTHYLASTVIFARSEARENFVAPEEIPVPKRLPVFTLKAAQNHILSFRTGMPVTLEVNENGRTLPDKIMFADFLHRNYRWLDLSTPGTGDIKQAAFVEEKDPRLDRAGISAKTAGFVIQEQNGDIFAFTTEISRDNTAHNHRTAGFVTAGLSFLIALLFALFIRSRFRFPPKRRAR